MSNYKKILSVLLALILALSTLIVTPVGVSAAVSDSFTPEPGKLYFDAASAGWTYGGTNKVAFYIVDDQGNELLSYGNRKSIGAATAGEDGIYEYDVATKTGVTLTPGVQYKVIFFRTSGYSLYEQTYQLYFTTDCLGKVAYCDGTMYENPVDNTKSAQAAYWKDIDAEVNGPVLAITSTGSVVGSCVGQDWTKYDLFVDFISVPKDDFRGMTGLENARENTVVAGNKTEQQMIDDIGEGLGLTIAQVVEAFTQTGVETTWDPEMTTMEGHIPPTEAPPTEASTDAPDSTSFEYSVADGKAAITKYTGTSSNVVIPEEIGGYPVKEVDECFPADDSGMNRTVRSVTFSKSVVSLKDGLFSHCSSLESVTVLNPFLALDNKNIEKYYDTESSGNVFRNELSLYGYNGSTAEKYARKYTKVTFFSLGDYNGSDEVCYDYTVNSSGQATITEYHGTSENLTILGEIEGYPVIEIGDNAFRDNKTVKNLIIPEGVVTIGNYAFYATVLETVQLPDSLTTIGGSAFGSSKLNNIEIPDSVTSIGADAFSSCTGLTEVTVPPAVTSIGSYAFSSCTGLTRITIPQTVTSMGYSMFYNCSPELTIYGYTYSLAEAYAQKNNIKFEAIGEMDDSIYFTYTTENGEATVTGYNGYANDIRIPAELGGCPVTAIGAKAFLYSEITSVKIPGCVTKINDKAFDCCENLKSAELCEGIQTIGQYAFDYCHSLEEITLPDSVFEIDDAVFRDCQKLKSVNLSSKISVIPYYAFQGCVSLEEITLSENVRKLDQWAFYGCTALKKVVFNDTITDLSHCAFMNCSALEEIEVPATVSFIGNKVFSGCSSLKKITILDPYINFIASDCFTDCSADLTVYGYSNSFIEKYTTENNIPFVAIGEADDTAYFTYTENDGKATVTGYKGYKTIVEIPSSLDGYPVTQVSTPSYGSFFPSDLGVTEVVFPDSVTFIHFSFFTDCPTLRKATIPPSVTYIYVSESNPLSSDLTICGYTNSFAEYYADANELTFEPIGELDELQFYQYNNYYGNIYLTGYKGYHTSITVPEKLDGKPVVSVSRFTCSSQLREIVLPDTIKTINSGAFQNCSNLKRVILPEHLPRIPTKAFGNCGLTEITIPESVTVIESQAFSSCRSLNKVTIPPSVIRIADDAFEYCSDTMTIYGYTNSVAEFYAEDHNFTFVSIGEANESYYYTYTVEDGKATITDYHGFMKDFVIPDTLDGYPVVAIGNNAFKAKEYDPLRWENYKEDMLTRIVIPESVKRIGAYAFNYQWNLTDVTILSKDVEIDEDCCIGRTYEWRSDYDLPTYYYVKNFTLRGYTVSTAEAYSTQFEMNFAALDHEPIDDSDKPFTYKIYGGGAHITGYTGNEDEVVVPDTLSGYPVVSIENRAFAGKNVKRVTLPDSVTRIEASAFENCSALNKVTLPDNAVSIGDNAFRNCQALDNITIPAGAAVGKSAFNECSSLETITFKEKPEYIGRQAFHNTPWYDNQPDGHVYIYDIAYAYKGQCPALLEYRPGTRQISNLDPETKPTAVIIPDGITELPFMFGHRSLKSIVIPASVTEFNYLGYDSIGSTEGFAHADLVIIGERGSAAEEYANRKGCTFAVYAPSEDDEVAVSAPEGCVYSFVDKHGSATADEATPDEAEPYEEEPLPEGAVVLDSYDITLYDMYGNPVQPESPVTVRIRCDDPKARVYRRETNGSLTDMHAVYEDGWLIFDVDHFSLYIVATGAEIDIALCGDADGDGRVTSLDVANIQRYIAALETGIPNEILLRGDVDGNGKLEIIDATCIQRYLAKIDTPYAIGKAL